VLVICFIFSFFFGSCPRMLQKQVNGVYTTVVVDIHTALVTLYLRQTLCSPCYQNECSVKFIWKWMCGGRRCYGIECLVVVVAMEVNVQKWVSKCCNISEWQLPILWKRVFWVLLWKCAWCVALPWKRVLCISLWWCEWSEWEKCTETEWVSEDNSCVVYCKISKTLKL